MEKIYQKLVRDKIPELIKKDNAKPKTRELETEEYKIELFKKLEEEVKEMIEASNNKEELIKEIGDIYEVVDSIIEQFRLDKNEIIDLQKKRREERGGFERKIFLESVEEGSE